MLPNKSIAVRSCPRRTFSNLKASLYFALTSKPIPTLYTVHKKGENSFLMDNLIDSPAKLNPKIPPVMSNLVMESISTRIEKRPADMDSVITRLELAKHILEKQANPTAIESSHAPIPGSIDDEI